MLKKALLAGLSLGLMLTLIACQSDQDEDAVAYVDGVAIPIAAFEQLAEQEEAQIVQSEGIDPESDEGQQVLAEKRQELLDDMINQKLLYQHAVEEGYTADEEQIEEELASIKGSYEEDAFEEALEMSGLTEEMLKSNIRENLVTYDFLHELDPDFSPRSVTEEELDEAYELYKEQVNDPLPKEDMIPDLEEYLFAVQEEEAYQTYYEELLESLREAAEIEILLES